MSRSTAGHRLASGSYDRSTRVRAHRRASLRRSSHSDRASKGRAAPVWRVHRGSPGARDTRRVPKESASSGSTRFFGHDDQRGQGRLVIQHGPLARPVDGPTASGAVCAGSSSAEGAPANRRWPAHTTCSGLTYRLTVRTAERGAARARTRRDDRPAHQRRQRTLASDRGGTTATATTSPSCPRRPARSGAR